VRRVRAVRRKERENDDEDNGKRNGNPESGA
jgi:hypothetical protein